MLRRSSIRLAIFLGALALGWAGLRSAHTAEGKGSAAPFVHTVIVYLKKDAPNDEPATLIADVHGMLAKIPTVRELQVGRPAEPGSPEFAVKDFHVGLMMRFDDFAGLEAYLNHDRHKAFLEKHLKHVDKVLVYDFVNQPK